METKVTSKPSPLQAWFLASRPKSLTLSILPIALGVVLAYTRGFAISGSIMAFAMISALFIQIGTNLINDALDFKKGADSESRLGFQRATQNGWLSMQQVFNAGIICFALTLLFGIPLIMQGGLVILILLITSVILGYVYTGGPMPLAYYGLGDLFAFLFFGLVATTASYYLQTGSVSAESILAGLQLGFLVTNPIAINNLRDIEGDGKAAKRTLAVRFGKMFARCEISFLTIAPFILNLLWHQTMILLLPYIALPIAITLVKSIWKYEPGKIYNKLFGLSVLLHFLFSSMLLLGALIP